MKELYQKLIFYPVNTISDRVALKGSSNCLTNATKITPSTYQHILWDINLITDSGGLQISTQGFKKDKTILIGQMLTTRMKDPEFLTIGLISNCQEYYRLKSDIGFYVDIPSGFDDSDFVYYLKLSESIKARDDLFEIAKTICPSTELGLVLHPRNPLEVADYFGLIATPTVGLYGYPAGNKARNALGNAFVLSFLHSVGVRHVHFLGSSAVPIIILLAKAVSLNMFTRCTFDSLTWNQYAVSRGHRYLNPETLFSMPKNESLHPSSDLRWRLAKHPRFFREFQKHFEPPDYMSAKVWHGIVNIEAIKYFKDRVLDDITRDKMPRALMNPGFRGKNKVIDALRLLDESMARGHDFIEGKYGPILE